jgi:vacuolar-type H+-ATPase subunit E/Vma4
VGRDELLEALRRQQQQQIKELRQRSTEHLAELTAQREEALERLRSEHARGLAVDQESLRAAVLERAHRQAAEQRLAAEEALATRLAELARRLLRDLPGRDDPTRFAALVAELPDASWETVRVNPGDRALVEATFPGIKVVVDPAVSGGLETADAEGRIVVDNTLETRLKRAWEDLLPALMLRFREGDGEDEPAAER